MISLTHFVNAAEWRIYLGSGASKTGPGKISVADFDGATGQIGPVREVFSGGNPTFLASNRDQTVLYAALENQEGSVAAWKVQKDGTLLEINRQPTGGRGTCHVSLTPSGKWLLAADYSSGSVASFRLLEDGAIGERSSHLQLTGSGPNPARQKQPHAHGIYSDPGERHVYVVDLGTDRVWTLDLDAETGKLTFATPDSVLLTPGAGPRHLAFSKDGNHVFVNGELDLTIHSLKRNRATGELTPVGNWPVLPREAIEENASTAEIFVHPAGDFVTVSTRTLDALVTFAIGPNGELTKTEEMPAGVKMPRYFGFTADGSWLLAAGQNDDRVVVFQIDKASGRLIKTAHEASVPSPVAIEFIKQGGSD